MIHQAPMEMLSEEDSSVSDDIYQDNHVIDELMELEEKGMISGNELDSKKVSLNMQSNQDSIYDNVDGYNDSVESIDIHSGKREDAKQWNASLEKLTLKHKQQWQKLNERMKMEERKLLKLQREKEILLDLRNWLDAYKRLEAEIFKITSYDPDYIPKK